MIGVLDNRECTELIKALNSLQMVDDALYQFIKEHAHSDLEKDALRQALE